MSSAAILTTEVVAVSAVSTGISAAVSFDPLLTALITFGVSLVTLVGGELIKYLVAVLKKKTKEATNEEDVKKIEDKDDKKEGK